MSKKKMFLVYLIVTVIAVIIPPFLLALTSIVYIIKFGHLHSQSKRIIRATFLLNLFVIGVEIYDFFREVI